MKQLSRPVRHSTDAAAAAVSKSKSSQNFEAKTNSKTEQNFSLTLAKLFTFGTSFTFFENRNFFYHVFLRCGWKQQLLLLLLLRSEQLDAAADQLSSLIHMKEEKHGFGKSGRRDRTLTTGEEHTNFISLSLSLSRTRSLALSKKKSVLVDSRLAGAPFALTNTIIYSIGENAPLSLSLSFSVCLSLYSFNGKVVSQPADIQEREREFECWWKCVCVRVFVCADVREREREGETGRPCRSPLTLSACPIPCTLYRRPALIRSKCILNFSLSLTQTHHCDDHCLLGLACTNKEYMYYLTRVISIEMLLTTYPVKVKMSARVFLCGPIVIDKTLL